MKREVRGAIRAGAIGFTTSRTRNHQTPDGQPVASRLADWNEVRELVGVLGQEKAGVFEIASEDTGTDPERVKDYQNRLKALALDFGVPVTYGMFSNHRAPDYWRPYFDLADETVAAGGKMFIQVHSRALNVLLSFESTLPFDKLPVWSDIRKLPLAEQEAALRNPEMRAKLVAAAHEQKREGRGIGVEARRANYKWLFVMDSPMPPYRSVQSIADEQGKDPVEVIIDLALAKHLKQFFLQPLANENQDDVLEMMRHPRSVVTFSDSGAHVSQIMDSSLQSHMLSHWVRDKAGVHAGKRHPDADGGTGVALGFDWTRDVEGRLERGRNRLRSEADHADAAGTPSRFAGRSAPPEAEGGRHDGDDRQWRGADAQQRAYGRIAGPFAARTAGGTLMREASSLR